MLQDLDKSLEALLRQELPSVLVEQVAISFAAPDNQFPPPSVNLPAINLFLYDVRENRDVRSNEPVSRRAVDGSGIWTPSPVRVDCSYLVTAWPSASAPVPIQDEHAILGAVLQILLRYPLLPEVVLQGSLANQDLPLPATALQPSRMQSASEFWQSLGGKLKVALSYTVTISVQTAQPFQSGQPVVDSRIGLSHLVGAL